MPKLFISHATQDRALVNPLRTALGHFGDQVFIAPEAIPPGEGGWSTILGAIAESELFMLVATPAACASASDCIKSADFQSFDLQDVRERSRLFDHLGLMTGRGNFWKGVAVTLAIIVILWIATRE
jgi:hypothetical protein